MAEKAIRTIERWIPRCGLWIEPSAEMVRVSLVEYSGDYFIHTPFATLHAHNGIATTDTQLNDAVRGYETESRAIEVAKYRYPYYHRKANSAVRAMIVSRYAFENLPSARYHVAKKIGHHLLPVYQWAVGEKHIPAEYRKQLV